MKKNAVLITIVSLVLVIGIYCSSVRNSVMKGASSGISKAVSERVEQSVYKRVASKASLPAAKTPGWNQFMIGQAQVITHFLRGGSGSALPATIPASGLSLNSKHKTKLPLCLKKLF